MRQRIDADLSLALVDRLGASQRVGTIDIHGAGATNTLAARAPEGERRVLVTLHLDQRVEHHLAAIFGVDIEGIGARVIARIWIVAIDLEAPRLAGAVGRLVMTAFLDLGIFGQQEFSHIFYPYRATRALLSVFPGEPAVC